MSPVVPHRRKTDSSAVRPQGDVAVDTQEIRNGAEQVPEDLTQAEVADRLEVDRSEDEGARDRASEVDRWEDEGGHDRAG